MLTLSISLREITNTPKITGSEDKEMKYVRESHSENANGEQIYVKEKGGHVKMVLTFLIDFNNELFK